ncbi:MULTISPECIES: THUMP-like domain-containing protein [unclassified Tenacibaculum]|uniref:THUMP-like domain-containing protein n=1 Tax=unclassified Tenacibaculum TaxID=2635139 RepID=UPI001F17BEAA|nr:RsmD family RNA methyltransferase [Tenacibaculum sp. Cn5-34]MCF2873853.1 class I SAM-dependent methyltransferase [Tenacibaculum sp. Cn5-1]MCF2936663.1 class I SAM-dependent methyltransferase [Tenacibaculum sp. Cn5-34]MCG7512887.1 class I SAM-dependent methyltransferase [Tenacibaculum sp. Cn5-46]
MNKAILQPDVQLYIQQNLKTDINKLILKGSPFNNITIQELANQIVAKQKSEKKLPTWFNTQNIYYPEKLSIEQTSSEITAEYKSNLVSGDTIIDLTGGFGVDCLAFSKNFKKVIHCEINEQLSAIVKYNYDKLGITNIQTIAQNGIDFLKQFNEKLNCIYIDPSRRHDIKGKVFLLKDCLPNVPENIDFLFTKANKILIKNSPILDITSTINELKFVKEIHIISLKNEVKELLFLLEKNHKESIQIKTHNLLNNNIQCFDFIYKNQSTETYSSPQNYLYEPNASILKSGGFTEVSYQLKINKLQQHSHLYTSEELVENFPGRIFKINNVYPYNKKKVKKFIKTEKANITTRNFPKTVAQIRLETKIKDGGDTYLFFTKNLNNELIIIDCSKE